MTEIDGLYAVRVVTAEHDEFLRTVRFYRTLLCEDPFSEFGDAESKHEAAFFRVGEVQLVITREEEPTPEAKLRQAAVWLCFKTPDPGAAFAEANLKGASLEHPPVPTSFGTEAFFSNDPAGLAVYVGTPWD